MPEQPGHNDALELMRVTEAALDAGHWMGLRYPLPPGHRRSIRFQ